MKKDFYLSLKDSTAGLRRQVDSGARQLASAGLLAATLLGSGEALAQRQLVRQTAETLRRGVVAVDKGNGEIFVSWRLLAADGPGTSFDLYRQPTGGAAVKLNTTPISTSTNWVDTAPGTVAGTTYFVRAVRNGVAAAASDAAPVWPQQFMRLPLQQPAAGVTPANEAYTYSPGDCSVGDVDGDGQQEIIVKWDPSNQKDNSQSGYTGNVYLDAYKLDGTRLWRIDLGRNIRAGAHYTQFMVYDLDGDGRAEVACKTADGTIDGTGQVLGSATADYRTVNGYILSGPEKLTVFNGLTGAAYPSVTYLPQRHPTVGDNPTPAQINAIWGDNYGNRIDRFLAAVAYLDGVHPSLVMCRGYYTRTVLVAWDFRNGQLTERWTFDSNDGTPGNLAYRGQGNHNLSVADVDGDGKDEIVYGSCAIDDNGAGLYSTGRAHGDAMHVSDFDPTRPGLEVFSVHESPSSYGSAPNDFRDAATGTLIWGAPGPNQGDVGRGIAMDVDPRTLGAESWSSRGGLYAANGTQISTARPGSMNFAAWWDGDLLRENLDGTTISKWNWLTNTSSTLLNAGALGAGSNNSTKATPNLSADLLGDWREEVIWRNTNNQELLIFTTTIPTNYRLRTLLQDSHYRLSIAWQNVGYNQPPHTGFYLGEGMPMAGDSLVWTGTSSNSWNTAANWSPTGVPTATDDVLIPNTARQPRLGTEQAVHSLALAAGAVLTAPAASTLTVNGDLNTRGGALASTGDATVILTGSTPQTLGGSGPLAFRNLTVGAATARLAGPVQVGRMLTLNGNLTTNNNLMLQSDTTGTAMVVNNGTAATTGNVTVKRYINPAINSGAGYRHYASPVQGATVGGLATSGFTPVINPAYDTLGNTVTPFPNVFGYNETRLTAANPGFDQGYYSPMALSDVLAPGQGYTVNVPASQTLAFVGALNNGTVSQSGLTRGPQPDAGWQLLGNPYAAPLNWDLVSLAGVGSAVYVYRSSGQYAGTYSSYVAGLGGIGTNGGTNQLALGQGFFVRTSTAGASGTVSFTNAARLTTYANPTFNRTTTTNALVRLEVRPTTGSADETVVYFAAGATPGFDAQFDADKLPGSGSVLLASDLGNAQALSINALAPLGVADVTVPLRVQASQSGTYTLLATELLHLPAGTHAYLRDAQTGTQTDLNQATGYACTLAAGAPATGRFSLLITQQRVLATPSPQLSQQVVVFPNPAHRLVSVQLPASLSSQAIQATLLNALGQAVTETRLAATAGEIRTIALPALAPGVYTLRLQTSAGQVVKRLTVN
jgi:rhamnogalacturonan endolyase